jgi:hypothetical protein
VHSDDVRPHVPNAMVRSSRAVHTPADVTALLASQPTPAMPEHLAARVTDAIAAESARHGTPQAAGSVPEFASDTLWRAVAELRPARFAA